MNKVIVRVKGGLGNQLFCYAAARRLAIKSDAELVIDDRTGFRRDSTYRRSYMLSHFAVPARLATAHERMEPLERWRRGVLKYVSRMQRFETRRYIEQFGDDFDPRLLARRITGTVYLDGLWQSESYFADIAAQLREDLRFKPPADAANLEVARVIDGVEAVAVHVRWFHTPDTGGSHNIAAQYYQRAIAMIRERLPRAQLFVFSDDVRAARKLLGLPSRSARYVSHNNSAAMAYADLWLMSRCRHFITANSTFSWWGAWLADAPEKTVIAPGIRLSGTMAWGFEGLIPANWSTIDLETRNSSSWRR